MVIPVTPTTFSRLIFSICLYFLYLTCPSQTAPFPPTFQNTQLFPILDGVHRAGDFSSLPITTRCSLTLSISSLHSLLSPGQSDFHAYRPGSILVKDPTTPTPSTFPIVNTFNLISEISMSFQWEHLPLCLFIMFSYFSASSFCSLLGSLSFLISTCFWLTYTLTQFQISPTYDCDT